MKPSNDTTYLDELRCEINKRYKKMKRHFKAQREWSAYYSEYMRQVGMQRCAMEDGKAEGLELGMAEGRVKGLAEGRAEGRAEGKEQDAIKMIEKGLDLEFIHEITEISLDKLQQMQKDKMQ
jgi:predicted transposase/invertase (TIGR01784 family)